MTKRVMSTGWVAGIAMAVLTGGLTLLGATAPAQASGSTVVQFGTFNLSGVNNDSRASGEQKVWRKRRPVVVTQILREGIDVLGVQEANPARAYRDRLDFGANQYMDLLGALRNRGANYKLTNAYAFNCETPSTMYRCVPKYRGASGESRILFNASKLTKVSAGSLTYANQTAGKVLRHMAWAIFEIRATGKRFLFSTTHLDPYDKVSRQGQWNEMIAKLNDLKGDLPVVATGDFNTSKFSPWAETFLPKMRNNGFGDVMNQQFGRVKTAPRADSTVRSWVNSFNDYRRNVAAYGYEDDRRKIGNGIDWIFATYRLDVRQYEVVVDMNSSLYWNRTIPSDHCLIRAAIAI
jgi:endonuclease/exonuclease/phosphatase family metal-dependent hydrolase